MEVYRNYFHKYKYPFFAAIACVTCEAACDLMGPTLMARIIDQGIQKGVVSQVVHWGLLMLLVTGIGAVFAVSRNVLASHVSQRVGADLRMDLFVRIMNFSEEGADRIESGSLITRMTNDTTQVVQFVNGIMRVFLKAPVLCIGSIVLATMLNVRLSVIIYGVVAVVACLILVSMRLSYPRFFKLQQAMDQVNCVVQEYLIGVRLVKAFGTYDQERGRFKAANEELMKRGVSSQVIITFVAPLLNLTVGFGTVLAIYAGSRLFGAGMAGVGDVSAFTIYMAQILSSLLIITNVFNTFVRTKASTGRIKEVMGCQLDFGCVDRGREGGKEGGKDQGDGRLPKGPLKGKVEFRDVTFAYPGGSGLPVLKGLSFSVEAGDSLAVIGPTGSGKSTIAWLLLRFYDVDQGAILLDGKDIQDLDVGQVRKTVALVPQKPMLFTGTVKENILWGRPEASDQEVKEAVDMAQAGFVEDMPWGYESGLGSQGVNLSGGQKQRISMARGLVRQAPILVLDDATSALDAVTEAKVRSRLLEKAGNRTMVIITQRCTTAMFAKKILVMEDGVLAGLGSHEELMENCQIYRDIYHSQVEGVKKA